MIVIGKRAIESYCEQLIICHLQKKEEKIFAWTVYVCCETAHPLCGPLSLKSARWPAPLAASAFKRLCRYSPGIVLLYIVMFTVM